MYSWQFANLNFKQILPFIMDLKAGGRTVVAIVGSSHGLAITSRTGTFLTNPPSLQNQDYRLEPAPFWLDGVLVMSDSEIEDLPTNLDRMRLTIKRMVMRRSGYAFLMGVGPVSNIIISLAMEVNSANVYIDMGSALDPLVSRHGRVREYFPTDGDELNYIRAGGALEHGQNCTETRYRVVDGSVEPVLYRL
jgi:hypothetical protein